MPRNNKMATTFCSRTARLELVRALMGTGLFGENEAIEKASEMVHGTNEKREQMDTSMAIKKLLTNQQAFAMLSNIPNFSGESVTRFDSWIKQFDGIADLSGWNDRDKITMLTSKLTKLASR